MMKGIDNLNIEGKTPLNVIRKHKNNWIPNKFFIGFIRNFAKKTRTKTSILSGRRCH